MGKLTHQNICFESQFCLTSTNSCGAASTAWQVERVPLPVIWSKSNSSGSPLDRRSKKSLSGCASHGCCESVQKFREKAIPNGAVDPPTLTVSAPEPVERRRAVFFPNELQTQRSSASWLWAWLSAYPIRSSAAAKGVGGEESHSSGLCDLTPVSGTTPLLTFSAPLASWETEPWVSDYRRDEQIRECCERGDAGQGPRGSLWKQEEARKRFPKGSRRNSAQSTA